MRWTYASSWGCWNLFACVWKCVEIKKTDLIIKYWRMSSNFSLINVNWFQHKIKLQFFFNRQVFQKRVYLQIRSSAIYKPFSNPFNFYLHHFDLENSIKLRDNLWVRNIQKLKLESQAESRRWCWKRKAIFQVLNWHQFWQGLKTSLIKDYFGRVCKIFK